MSPDQFKTASQQMASMSPDQLKQQSAVLRGMSKETLRRTNPFMANMSDSEIDMAINQMEKMASDPAMLKMASEQLKNMSPDQLEHMRNIAKSGSMMGGISVNDTNANGTDAPHAFPNDAAQMFDTLLANPEQVNSMVKMLKQNPDMIKQIFAAQLRGSDGQGADNAKVKQMENLVDHFSEMDDKYLEKMLKTLNTFRAVVKPLWKSFWATKYFLGVSAKTLIVLINIVFAFGTYMFYKWLKARGGVEDALLDPLLAQEMPEIIGGDDEF
jgi:hypothetical protein